MTHFAIQQESRTCFPKEKLQSTTSKGRLLQATLSRMTSFNCALHSPTNCEFAPNCCPDRVAGGDYISENTINRVLVKDAQVAVTENVVLEGLQLQTDLVW